MKTLIRGLQYIWPAPWTLFGLGLGLLPFLGQRSFIFKRGTIGIVGPAMHRLLSRIPISGGAAAITFGHTILAADQRAFDLSFEHEWVHVRQYVWWGPLFVPAYLLNSLWHWMRRHDPYYDNDFERQARAYGD